MKLMHMPLFTWSVLASCIIIIFAFPVLTVTLALLFIDRFFDGHLFTMTGGGNPMMYINLIWMWGHPEVYIVVLPAFGIFLKLLQRFLKRRYLAINLWFSMMIISVLSYFTWVHHFFTMGAGANVNVFCYYDDGHRYSNGC